MFFFKQKTAYEIKECDWSSDVCSSDLRSARPGSSAPRQGVQHALTLLGRHDHPFADFLDRPPAAQAPAGGLVDLTDADAGRWRTAGEQPHAFDTAPLALAPAGIEVDIAHGARTSA